MTGSGLQVDISDISNSLCFTNNMKMNILREKTLFHAFAVIMGKIMIENCTGWKISYIYQLPVFYA